MKQTIQYDKEARESLKKGVDTVANAVKVTLGRGGRNVVCKNVNGFTRITKDGVTVANNVFLHNEIESVGAEIIKGAARKTALEAGDGTTTSTIIAQAVFNEALKTLESGTNPIQLKKEIDEAVKLCVAYIKEKAIPCTDDDLFNVATISANGDEEIGKNVADIFKRMGVSASVTIEDSNGEQSSIETMQGYAFDAGYKSPYLITNHAKQQAELDNPFILVANRAISQIKERNFKMLIDYIVNEQRPLLIICEDMDGIALPSFVKNHMEGLLRMCVVKAPFFGEKKGIFMEDFATSVGATVVNVSPTLDEVTPEHLGSCDRAVVTGSKTFVANPHGDKDKVEQLCADIEAMLVEEQDEMEREQLRGRLSRLKGAVARYRVGGNSDIERQEKKDRVDDAIRATKSAMEEGIVIGGGKLLHECANHMASVELANGKPFALGNLILRKAIQQPMAQMLFNCGKGDDIYPEGQGYNATTDKIEPLMEAGIIDPAKVVRCAVVNGASVASTLFTSECLIFDQQ